MQRQRARDARDQALPAREIGRVEGAVGAAQGRREPDFASARAPRETLRGLEGFREALPFSGPVHHGDGAAVVSASRMVDVSDFLSAGRHSEVADPPRRLVERFPDRELEAVAASDLADDREAGTIGLPVGPLDVFEDLPRSGSASHAHARECSARHEGPHGVVAERDRHFSGFRDGEHGRARHSERPGLRALRAADEDLRRLSIDRGPVDDRLAVGSKPSRGDRSPPESELPERGRLGLAGASPQGKGDEGRGPDRHRGSEEDRPESAPAGRAAPAPPHPREPPCRRGGRGCSRGRGRGRGSSRIAPRDPSPGTARRSSEAAPAPSG